MNALTCIHKSLKESMWANNSQSCLRNIKIIKGRAVMWKQKNHIVVFHCIQDMFAKTRYFDEKIYQFRQISMNFAKARSTCAIFCPCGIFFYCSWQNGGFLSLAIRIVVLGTRSTIIVESTVDFRNISSLRHFSASYAQVNLANTPHGHLCHGVSQELNTPKKCQILNRANPWCPNIARKQ